MRRPSAWLVSVVVHGGLAVALIALGRSRPAPARPPIAVTVAEASRGLPRPAPAAIAPTPSADPGGGRPTTRVRRPAPRPRAAAPRPDVASARSAASAPPAIAEPAAPAEIPGPGAGAPPTASPSVAAGGGDRGGGDGGGDGGGRGGGHGPGRGPGQGWSQTLAAAGRLARTPRRSLARPARLIWPVRTGDESQGTLVTARLRVDDDGYVVGVRLPTAPLRRRDQEAAAAVWKFRYDPARDDAGRPIASTVEQAFILRR